MIRRRWPQRNSSRTCTRSGAASTSTAGSRSGAATPSSSHASSGRPASSSRRTTSRPRPRLLQAFARAHRRLRGRVRVEGVPLHRRLPAAVRRRASAATSRGGELALALRGGVDPERIHMHGNAKSAAELRYALEAGVGEVIVDNQRDLDLLEELGPATRGAAAGRAADRARRAARDAPGDLHRAGRTRSSASTSRAPPRRSSARARAPRSTCAGLHMHIGSQIMELEPFRARARALMALGEFDSYNLGGGLGVAYTARTTSRPRSRTTSRRRSTPSTRSPARGSGSSTSRAARSSPTPASRSTRSRRSSATSRRTSRSTAGCRTTCGRCSTAPATRPRCRPARRRNALPHRREALRIGRRDHPRRGPRRPAAGGRARRPATGAYGHAMVSQYNGALRPPVVFVKDGDARLVVRRDTYEDLLARDL